MLGPGFLRHPCLCQTSVGPVEKPQSITKCGTIARLACTPCCASVRLFQHARSFNRTPYQVMRFLGIWYVTRLRWAPKARFSATRADHRGRTRCFRPAAFSMEGGFHAPVRMEALGQYNRMTRLKSSGGAGSQLDSLRFPGDSCWT